MILTAALALSVAVAPKGFTEGPSVEGVAEYRLPNGLKVLFINDPSKQTTTVNLTVFVGSRHENYGEKGMAHLFEHLCFKETKKFKDVKRLLTDLGGAANGTTWFDRTNYFESFPATDSNLKKALEIEAERLVNTIVTKEKLAPEMTVVRNEFEMGENSPTSVLGDRVMASAFLWHNYRATTIGAKSDIELVPQERITSFYKNYYQPDNAMLVIAGKFDETKAAQMVLDTLGKIPKPARSVAPTYTIEPTQDGERTVTIRRVGGTPVLMAAYHVPAGTDPDYAAVNVMESLLSSAPAGRLYKDLVETKKAAKVSCEGYRLKEPGAFICTAELRASDKPDEVRNLLLSSLEGIAKKPFDAKEIDRAKTVIGKEYDLLLNDSESIGIALSEFAAMGDWRMLFLHRDRVAAVTAADIARVGEKYFKPSNRTVGEYVPTEKPDRAEIPAVGDLSPVLSSYKGKEALAKGEAFDASPKNLDARTITSSLANGMKLALLPKKTRGETVQAELVLRYGTESSLQNTRAASEMAIRLLSRGTKSKTRQQFKDALDQLKAQVGFRAASQGVVANIEVRRPQLIQTLSLVTEALQSPAFDDKELEEARRAMLADLERAKDDPQTLGSTALRRLMTVYPKGHPLYAPTIDEQIADLKAVKVDDVKGFHKSFYGAQNGFLAMVGDFDVKEMTELFTKQFGNWKAASPFTRIPNPNKPIEATASVVPTPDKPMAFFAAATRIQMKESDADFPTMMLADYMLGGGFLSGRVPQRLREKDGLSYGAGTQLAVSPFHDNAALVGFAIYNPTNVEKVEQGFKEEIARAVSSGFTEEEMKAAIGGMMQAREGRRGDDRAVAGALTENLEVGRTFAFEQQYDDKVKTMKLDELNRVLKKYVDPAKFAIVKAGAFKTVTAPK